MCDGTCSQSYPQKVGRKRFRAILHESSCVRQKNVIKFSPATIEGTHDAFRNRGQWRLHMKKMRAPSLLSTVNGTRARRTAKSSEECYRYRKATCWRCRGVSKGEGYLQLFVRRWKEGDFGGAISGEQLRLCRKGSPASIQCSSSAGPREEKQSSVR